MRIIGIERTGDIYVARDANEVAWAVEVHLDMSGTPFRDEIVWPAASVVAIGGGNAVHFLSTETGAVVKTLSLAGDLFGHFGPGNGDVLYILGWRHVFAVDRALAVRWVAKDVAIDGITWRGCQGNRIQIAAEIDPPGGWVDVELDEITGREIARGDRHGD